MKPHRDCKEQTRAWRREVPNRLEDAATTAAEAGEHLRREGVAATAAHAVHFAIEEMLTNTVKYGHPASPSRVTVEVLPDTVIARIEDDGRAFNPLKAPTPHLPANLDDRTPGGLGIHIVRQMVSSLAYERRDGRNHLTITVART
jgi:serine/threonine-protein kinase RsbW